MLKRLFAVCLASLALTASADQAPRKMSAQDFLAALHFKDGRISLPGKLATLDLPAEFRYLPPEDTERVLVEAWGNPPNSHTLGMIVPARAGVLSDEGWGVIITYDKDGHVRDDDADQIDYADLLKDMKKAVEDENTARKEQGYAAMTLIGWAEKPSYARGAHKLYWAKEFATEGSSEHTLNYNVRVLGREGVLVLNAVAGMHQIADVKTEMQKVTAFTEFTKGNGYADFNSSADKVAEYGIAALVAGGVAAKLGLFGKLFALLLAFKKLAVLGLAAIGSALYKFFGGRRKEQEQA